MKRLHIEKHIYTALLTLCVATFFTACETVNTDPPVITNIRLIDPEQADTEIDGAGLNTWLVIQGTGLATAREVYFNEFAASFNPALVSNENIVIQIPEATPNIGTDSVLTNTVRVVTAYGEDTYTGFIVYAPPAIIERMSCEFALPGDTMTLMGKYFFGVDSVIFPTALSAVILDEAGDGTSCTVIVPEGATEPGPIRVVTSGGSGGTGDLICFRDTISTVKCNFDNVNIYIWGCDIIGENSSFPGANGNFAHIYATNVPENDNQWWSTARSCNLDSVPWFTSNDLGKSPAGFLLKFEMFVDEPWVTGSIMVNFNYTFGHMFRIQPWVVEGERVAYKSSAWETIYVPLDELRLGEGLGDQLDDLNNLAYSNGYAKLAFFHFNNGNTDADLPSLAEDYFSIAIDNIRIVKVEE